MESDDAFRRHVFTHPSPVEHWRHLIEIIALVVAALWGFYVFVYQERIKPAAERPNVDFSVSLHHENLIHDKELITVVPVWRNKGAIAAQVDGYILNIYGLQYGGNPDELKKVRYSFGPPYVISETDTRALTARWILVQTFYQPWRPLGGRYYGHVQPEDTLSFPDTVAVPRGKYEAVAVAYAFCVRRADDLRSFHFFPPRAADGSFDFASLNRAEKNEFGLASCPAWPDSIFAI